MPTRCERSDSACDAPRSPHRRSGRGAVAYRRPPGAIRNRSGDEYKPSSIRGYEEALRIRVLPSSDLVVSNDHARRTSRLSRPRSPRASTHRRSVPPRMPLGQRLGEWQFLQASSSVSSTRRCDEGPAPTMTARPGEPRSRRATPRQRRSFDRVSRLSFAPNRPAGLANSMNTSSIARHRRAVNQARMLHPRPTLRRAPGRSALPTLAGLSVERRQDLAARRATATRPGARDGKSINESRRRRALVR